MVQPIEKVQPGDLITAQFINRIVDEINTLRAKVAGLESIGPVGGKVFITKILPETSPPRVNEQMHIIGQNFGFLIGATEVMLDGNIRIDTFLAGSDDQNLVFIVPAIPNLLQGRPVNVKVSNVSESAQKEVFILPAELALEGGVDVLFKTADPLAIKPGNPATFEYSLKSRASLAADYTITTEVTGVNDPVPWQKQIELLNSQKSKAQGNKVHLDVDETKTFFIRIPSIPSNPGDDTFGLKVTAAAGVVAGADGPREFTVGVNVVPPDPDSNLIFNTAGTPIDFLPTSAGSLKLDSAIPTIILMKPTDQVANPLARVNLTAAVRVAGQYAVKALIASGTGWTATVNTAQVPNPFVITEADFSNSDEATKPLRIVVKALASATAQAELEIQLQRTGSTLKQVMRFNLALP